MRTEERRSSEELESTLSKKEFKVEPSVALTNSHSHFRARCTLPQPGTYRSAFAPPPQALGYRSLLGRDDMVRRAALLDPFHQCQECITLFIFKPKHTNCTGQRLSRLSSLHLKYGLRCNCTCANPNSDHQGCSSRRTAFCRDLERLSQRRRKNLSSGPRNRVRNWVDECFRECPR